MSEDTKKTVLKGKKKEFLPFPCPVCTSKTTKIVDRVLICKTCGLGL